MTIAWKGHGTRERWQDARRRATRRAMADIEWDVFKRRCRRLFYWPLLIDLGLLYLILRELR